MIQDRIRQIIDNEQISIRSFEKKISVSVGVITKSLSKNTDFSVNTLIKIKENFQHYSSEWLLTGEGPMLKPAQKEESEADKEWRLLYFEQKTLLEKQNAIIDRLEEENKKLHAQVEGNVECADADMKITG